MSGNEQTLRSYEEGVVDYNAAAIPTVEGSMQEWVDKSLAMIPPEGHILELGSAHGRDADYMEALGFVVDRTDAVEGFVNYLKGQGHKARLLNALTDDFGGPYDMVYAQAVLLHFTPDEAGLVIHKAHEALKPRGIFSFSLKVGEGSDWQRAKIAGQRFFTYWQEAPLRSVLSRANFDVLDMPEGTTGHNSGNWYHVIARKREIDAFKN